MKRWTVVVLLVIMLVPALAVNPVQAGGEDDECSRDKRKPGWDRDVTEFLYDVTIPWPFRKHAADTDGDGVADNRDKCPGTPKGAKVDANGCPLDSDGDGVFDGIDKCPDTPKGASVDYKGCPMDSDGDGVFDGIDKCPDTPKGVKVDRKGCPLDSDGDGVFDGIDKCPDTPKGVEVDAKGCPVSKVEKAMLSLGLFSTTEIVFDLNKAVIKPESHAILEEIGGVLVDHPELEVEIGGHTDATGEDSYNQTLSEGRAQAVRDYLLEKYPDIEKEQLRVRGYGEGSPVASNDTHEGRAKNRRVEFKVLKK